MSADSKYNEGSYNFPGLGDAGTYDEKPNTFRFGKGRQKDTITTVNKVDHKGKQKETMTTVISSLTL